MQIPKFSLWICALALCGGMTLRAEDTPAQAAARAALNQKLHELETNPSATNQPPPAAQPVPAAPAAAAAVIAAPAAAPVETPAPAAAVEVPAAPVAAPAAAAPAKPVDAMQPGDTEAQARARAALNQKMEELGTAPASAPATPAPVTAAHASKPTMQPMVAPALPIQMSKADKLQALLARYKADQITPEQYHEQRAAILAEP